ncbi:MAG TPA: YidB family protein [Burkholderiaceae bacterium]|nr:YidB family protein [Burkholderiaceae bacterium]
MGFSDRAFDPGNAEAKVTGPQAKLLQAALAMLSDHGQAGGLPGLIGRFQEAGLGDVIGSWISSGQNLPISAEQIQQILGNGHLQQISEETALTQDETATHLSVLLPDLIDRLTPNGQAPEGGFGDIATLLANWQTIAGSAGFDAREQGD